MASEIAVCFHFCFRKRFRRHGRKRFLFPLPHPSLRRGGTEARWQQPPGSRRMPRSRSSSRALFDCQAGLGERAGVRRNMSPPRHAAISGVASVVVSLRPCLRTKRACRVGGRVQFWASPIGPKGGQQINQPPNRPINSTAYHFLPGQAGLARGFVERGWNIRSTRKCGFGARRR